MVKEGLSIRLQEAREECGLFPREVAEKLNVTQQAVSNWEKGRTFPDVGNLVKLSDLYGVSLDWLLKGERTEATAKNIVEDIVILKEEEHEPVRESDSVNKNVLEIIGVSIILVLSCQFPLIGVFVPLVVFGWLIKTKRKNKILYILCICSLVISLYNTYVIFEHFFDWGKSTIEEVSSLW